MEVNIRFTNRIYGKASRIAARSVDLQIDAPQKTQSDAMKCHAMNPATEAVALQFRLGRSGCLRICRPGAPPGIHRFRMHPIASLRFQPVSANTFRVGNVFINYRRENDAHCERVRGLAGRLRDPGIDVTFDEFAKDEQYYGNQPPNGWPLWSVQQADGAAKGNYP